MNKDDYAKMKVRHEIVMAFMNKKGETLDIDLIPALVDYAETGDRKMFDDYNNFRKMTDIEKRAKEMKERVEDARADLERCKDQLKKTEETSEENRSQINDAIEKYRQWVRELKDTITKETPQDEYPTMKTLRDFAQICIDESPNGKQRKLWLKDGDNMKTVTAILFDGKKAVMEVGEPTTIIAPVPRYY